MGDRAIFVGETRRPSLFDRLATALVDRAERARRQRDAQSAQEEQSVGGCDPGIIVVSTTKSLSERFVDRFAGREEPAPPSDRSLTSYFF